MFTLYFYHDPMCSWCWGYRPVSDEIFARLPDDIERVDILGGLAPDSEQPMAADMRQNLAATWRRIEDMLGTAFNHAFWTDCEPRRSTYPACRAVLAAAQQDHYHEMVDAIQRAYYLRAMNPSDLSTLQQLASELDLDGKQFADDILSASVNDALLQQVRFASESPIRGFPSLVLGAGDSLYPVTQDYQSVEATLEHLERLKNSV